jgi:hypothetical protein
LAGKSQSFNNKYATFIAFILLWKNEGFFFCAQNKFNPENVARYIIFLHGIISIAPHRVKYFDKAHVESEDLKRRRALGPIGPRTMVVPAEVMVDKLRFTLTVVTNL